MEIVTKDSTSKESLMDWDDMTGAMEVIMRENLIVDIVRVRVSYK
jgi:hypothetical protein